VDPIAISRSALDVEWQRMQVIAQNLANENTATVGASGYRAVRLISGPVGNFAHLVSRGSPIPDPRGVQVVAIEPDGTGIRRVYDPGAPGADSSGFVTYPAIDHAREMTLLVETARAYESNLTVMALAQQMTMRALNAGQR
jgi:flagellar basal-body rod protein FlgC